VNKVFLYTIITALFMISCSATNADNPPQAGMASEGTKDRQAEVQSQTIGVSMADKAIPEGPIGLDNLALERRTGFMVVAMQTWLMNQNQIQGLITMKDISSKGFFPLWIIDPVNKNPIQIIQGTAPHLTQVSYYPIEDKGWDLSMISPRMVTDPNAAPIYNDSFKSLFSDWAEVKKNVSPEAASHISSNDWDDMIWAFKQECEYIMDSYVKDHGKVPTSFHEMLDGRYFINEDFINRAAYLISQGASKDFEMGIIIDNKGRNFFYTNFMLDNGIKTEMAWYYRIGPNGYDLTDPARKTPVKTPNFGNRTVYVSNSTIGDADAWLKASDHKALSEFFIQ
jgi:hypothetical protein